jgi:DUF971 family protein
MRKRLASYPVEVRTDPRRVYIRWSDGHESIFSNPRLREACPCAACQGESGILGKRYMLPVIASVSEDIRAVAHSMVGRYAISFVWSDGHKTGIYPYDYMLELCECDRCRGQSSA